VAINSLIEYFDVDVSVSMDEYFDECCFISPLKPFFGIKTPSMFRIKPFLAK